jgi:hypothetical protein
MRQIRMLFVMSLLLCLPAFAGTADPKRDIVGKWIDKEKKSMMEFHRGSPAGEGFVSISKGKWMVTSGYKFIDDSHFQIKEINVWKDYEIISLSGDRLELKEPGGGRAVYARAKAPSWVSHASKKGGFTAEFPQAPREDGLPSNGGQTDRLMCAADNGSVFCSVIVERYPDMSKSPEARIDQVYSREFGQSAVKSASSTFAADAFKVREYRKVARGMEIVRIYSDGKTVYIVMAALIGPQGTNEEIDRFISSFRTTK